MGEVIKNGMTWAEGDVPNATMRIGGWDNASVSSVDRWPCFKGKPLAYFGWVQPDSGPRLYLFIGDTRDGSWKPEQGANAVLGDGITSPEWVTMESVNEAALFSDNVYSTADPLPDAPKWLQGEETPEGYEFVSQIPSQIDGGDEINIGEGYGTAYVFRSEDGKSARVLWQS